MLARIKWLLLLVLCCEMNVAAAVDLRHYVVDVQAVNSARQADYYVTLLKMILDASKAPNEIIDYEFSDHQYSQARWIAELQRPEGNNVIWTVTTKEREKLLRAIRVPIFKDLLGKRVLVIRKADAEKFAQITTKEQLSEFVAGQGGHWPDTEILMSNGLPVTTGIGKENLYKMIVAKRFDYFPRGLSEIGNEAEFIAPNDLMVEPHLMLSYPEPIYFFVNKSNVELARRLERGWDIILKNGEFNKFFYAHPRVKAAIDELKNHRRIVIELNNVDLPADTVLPHSDFLSEAGDASVSP